MNEIPTKRPALSENLPPFCHGRKRLLQQQQSNVAPKVLALK